LKKITTKETRYGDDLIRRKQSTREENESMRKSFVTKRSKTQQTSDYFDGFDLSFLDQDLTFYMGNGQIFLL
jgi:hypothetical protein